MLYISPFQKNTFLSEVSTMELIQNSNFPHLKIGFWEILPFCSAFFCQALNHSSDPDASFKTKQNKKNPADTIADFSIHVDRETSPFLNRFERSPYGHKEDIYPPTSHMKLRFRHLKQSDLVACQNQAGKRRREPRGVKTRFLEGPIPGGKALLPRCEWNKDKLPSFADLAFKSTRGKEET